MAEWHWYCDQHGQIDRTVQVGQHGARTEGRCRCGAPGRWADHPSFPERSDDEQLALSGERS